MHQLWGNHSTVAVRQDEDVFAGLDDALEGADDGAASFRADGTITDPAHALTFINAGKATVTLVSKQTGARFTFKISMPKLKDGEVDTGFRFVSVLNGPDNWANYAYLGYVRRGVFFHGGRKAKVGYDAPSHKAFAWAYKQITGGRIPDSLEVWHEGKCGRCGRKLTVPTSIASGLGPECAGKVGFGS
jgi:hypothetical protein